MATTIFRRASCQCLNLSKPKSQAHKCLSHPISRLSLLPSASIESTRFHERCQTFHSSPKSLGPSPFTGGGSGPGSGTSKPLPFVNILADDIPQPVQVSSISTSGIQLTDGLIISGACIFLEGKVFLWDPPKTFWEGWKEDHFNLFEAVVPKPEILLLGTGKTIFQPPPFIREHLNTMGIQLDVMDTRSACSTYNLLSEEGRRVAAALLPLAPRTWQRAQMITDTSTGNVGGTGPRS